VKAGDLVIGDSRVLHAAHANDSDQRRTVITLWFHPNYDELPQDLQAAFVRRCDPVPADWPAEAKQRYESIVIRCDEGIAPTEFSRARDPEAVGS
jgi:ectoine hydroxylase-related dioxygenase (phytanoyl-CoA dioxygenase family)